MSSLTFGKVFYLARQTQRRLLSGNSGCPNCGSRRFVKMDAKAILIELRECQDCRLFYRFPTDSVEDNRAFYQKAYKQGVTTDLPDAATLARLKETGFTGHEKSYAGLIELLERLGVKRGARVFDYGCSWGFGSWQFSQAGYSVSAFEISVHRAAYGRMNLDIDCIDSLDQIEARNDLERTLDAVLFHL